MDGWIDGRGKNKLGAVKVRRWDVDGVILEMSDTRLEGLEEVNNPAFNMKNELGEWLTGAS